MLFETLHTKVCRVSLFSQHRPGRFSPSRNYLVKRRPVLWTFSDLCCMISSCQGNGEMAPVEPASAAAFIRFRANKRAAGSTATEALRSRSHSHNLPLPTRISKSTVRRSIRAVLTPAFICKQHEPSSSVLALEAQLLGPAFGNNRMVLQKHCRIRSGIRVHSDPCPRSHGVHRVPERRDSCFEIRVTRLFVKTRGPHN